MNRSEQQQRHYGTYWRNRAIIIRHHKGYKQKDIAEKYGMKRQRVYQIVKKYYPAFLANVAETHYNPRSTSFMDRVRGKFKWQKTGG